MSIRNKKIRFGYSNISDGNLDFRFDDIETVRKQRKSFFTRENIDPEQSVVFIAEHANNMQEVTLADAGKGVFSPDDQFVLDCLVTKEKNLNLCLLVADCISLVLYDEANEILAMVHVGSKNLALGTVGKAVKGIKEMDGSKEVVLHATTSPFIKKCCYDFHKIPEYLSDLKDYFIPKDDLYILDTENALFDQLIAAGIRKENIEINPLCSSHDNFPSHKRSAKTGELESRMLVYASMI